MPGYGQPDSFGDRICERFADTPREWKHCSYSQPPISDGYWHDRPHPAQIGDRRKLNIETLELRAGPHEEYLCRQLLGPRLRLAHTA